MIKQRIGGWMAACAVAFASAGCGGGGGAGASSTPKPVEMKVAASTFRDGATDVDPRADIIVTFDTAVEAGGVSASQVQLTRGGVVVPFLVKAVGAGIIITPVGMKLRSDHKLVVKAGAKGDNGATLPADYVVNFRTSPLLFETRQLLTSGAATGAGAVVAADINGDGRPDAVVMSGLYGASQTSQSAFSLWVYLQTPVGGLQLAQRIDRASLPAPYAVRLGKPILMDIDGDGRPEILISQWVLSVEEGSGLLVFKLDAAGRFQPQPMLQSRYLRNVQVADVDGDGRVDLIGWFSDYYLRESGFQVFLAKATGLQTMPALDLTQLRGVGEISVGDLDRDGVPELVINAFDQSNMVPQRPAERWVYRQAAPGVFQRAASLEALFAGVCADLDYCAGLKLVDIDGDGWLDLMFSSSGPEPLTLAYLRQPGAGFLKGFRYKFGIGNVSLNVMQLDRDGQADVLIFEDSAGYVAAALGNRRSDFEYSRAFSLPTSIGMGDGNFAIVDFNGDGRPDVLTAGGDTGIQLMQQISD